MIAKLVTFLVTEIARETDFKNRDGIEKRLLQGPPAQKEMLFTRNVRGGLLINCNNLRAFTGGRGNLKDQLPKDWVRAAEKELKGAPLEEIIWHTAEVFSEYANCVLLAFFYDLGNQFETNLYGRRCKKSRN